MSIVAGARQSHTTFEVLDIEESLRFYREVLGLSTCQHLDKVGVWCSTNHHVCACIQNPKLAAQPYWNYHARAVRREDVDGIYAKIAAVTAEYGIRELRAPETETRFGVGTYGFALCDRDGNWWRIEESDGPFGHNEIPDVPSDSIVPAGPISYVTLEVRDIEKAARFYRDVLGLDVTLRDGAIHYSGGADVSLIAVPVQGELLPQPVLNHHGITFDEGREDAVRAVHEALKAGGEQLGVKRLMPITSQHGSVSFYFQDDDTNWWEIETLEGGLDPWMRATLPDGDSRLLNPERGRSTLRQPFKEPVTV